MSKENNNQHPLKNTGVIEKPPKLTDYIAGIASGLAFEVRLPNGNWNEYRVLKEWQRNPWVDSMGCVSWSGNNGIECNIKWLIATKQLTKALVEQLLTTEAERELFWDFFTHGADLEQGEANLSDMALAVGSNTTKQGNWMSRVADRFRNKAVPEKRWPFNAEAKTWDELYKKILTDEEVDKYSEVFFKVFSVATEWVTPTVAEIKKHLQQGPIQIVCPICPAWSSGGVIEPCGIDISSHAVLEDAVTNVQEIFDHYNPFDKKLSLNYKIGGALKIVVTVNKPKEEPMFEPIDNVLYQLVEAPGGFAMGLGKKLIIDKVDLLLASVIVRNGGKLDGKVGTCTKAQWDSVPHLNLKGEPVA